MNFLYRSSLRQFIRLSHSTSKSPQNILAAPLSNRSLIHVQGEEVVPFLQGLITNDMNHLDVDKNPSMFAMFLNNSGRVLYDSIIYRTEDKNKFLIECDKEICDQLQKHLRMYRVRRKININSLDSELTPWVVYNPMEGKEPPKPTDLIKIDDVLCTQDPRVKELGIRIIQPINSSQIENIQKKFSNLQVEESTLREYVNHRYMYGVGEGIVDHPPGKCFPLEANCDFLHGVSFHKGCYVGQELTARVYHTGVIRKRLMPLKLLNTISHNESIVQTKDGASVGTVRGSSESYALALLRVEKVINENNLFVGKISCSAYKPFWWPNELPNRQSLKKD